MNKKKNKEKEPDDLQSGRLYFMWICGKNFIVHITKNTGKKISFTKLFKIKTLVCVKANCLKVADFTSLEVKIQTIKEHCLLRKEEKEQLEEITCQTLGALETKKTAAIKAWDTYRRYSLPETGPVPLKKMRKLGVLIEKKTAAIKKYDVFHRAMLQAGLIPEKEKE